MKKPTIAQMKSALLKAGFTYRLHRPYPYGEWRYGGNWISNDIKTAYEVELEAARARARRRKK